jgi:hypothetical protein
MTGRLILSLDIEYIRRCHRDGFNPERVIAAPDALVGLCGTGYMHIARWAISARGHGPGLHEFAIEIVDERVYAYTRYVCRYTAEDGETVDETLHTTDI